MVGAVILHVSQPGYQAECICACREAVNDVARCLARLDPDVTDADVAQLISQGSTTIQTISPDTHSQELAEAICTAAIEQVDSILLNELLSSQIADEGVISEIADILALLVAQRGHASIIPILAEKGAKFDRPDFHRGGPPLMHAANNGHASTVSALLEVSTATFVASSALFLFRRGECAASTFGWFMQGNADIHDIDNVGQTALMVAVFSGTQTGRKSPVQLHSTDSGLLCLLSFSCLLPLLMTLSSLSWLQIVHKLQRC